jgi:hypothetical protein
MASSDENEDFVDDDPSMSTMNKTTFAPSCSPSQIDTPLPCRMYAAPNGEADQKDGLNAGCDKVSKELGASASEEFSSKTGSHASAGEQKLRDWNRSRLAIAIYIQTILHLWGSLCDSSVFTFAEAPISVARAGCGPVSDDASDELEAPAKRMEEVRTSQVGWQLPRLLRRC